jgi:hypothetical protein
MSKKQQRKSVSRSAGGITLPPCPLLDSFEPTVAIGEYHVLGD